MGTLLSIGDPLVHYDAQWYFGFVEAQTVLEHNPQEERLPTNRMGQEDSQIE